MARHRAPAPDRRSRWRSSPPVIPERRRLVGIGLVDATTRVEHQVTPEALLAGRVAGTYQALCGEELMPASMTDPGLRGCAKCGWRTP